MHHFLRYPLSHLILLLVASILIVSCSDDDTMGPDVPPPGQDGYFIVNEGGFGNGNTSLSYYDRTRDTVLNNVFESANGRKLGDQSQSMTVIGDQGYIVVQNSSKIEVINRDDFTSVATITDGIASPRYLAEVAENKAYVTDWGADGVTGTVKVVDLSSFQVLQTIPVGQGPNEIVVINNRAYVANGGGLGRDSTVMVLDTQADAVVDTVVVGGNPSSLAVDANGALWVAGGGFIQYNEDFSAIIEEESTPGFLALVENDQVSRTLEASQINVGPSALVATSNQLYLRYAGAVYSLSPEATELPEQPLIDQRFYGLAVDPVSGEILGGEAPNFSSDGTFQRHTATGELIESYTVGIAPNGFAF